MGKMPLAGLIGACSLGMLLTGCNCCDKNKNQNQPSFAGGRMDSSMGFFSKTGKGPESKFISSDGVAGNSMIDSSDAVASTNSGSPQSGSSGTYTTDMAPPAGSGRMPSMGANMTSAGGLAHPPSDSNAVGMTMSGAGSGSNASPIRTVSQRMDDPSAVNSATYRPMDADTTPALPMRGSGPVVPPTPPTTDSAFAPYPNSKPSSSAAMGATNSISMATPGSSAPPPPTPPPSDSFGVAASNLSAGSLSSQASAGSAAPTNSGNRSLPPFLSGR